MYAYWEVKNNNVFIDDDIIVYVKNLKELTKNS